MDSFYVPADKGFEATELTRGPWSPAHQHGGPPSALLVRAIERLDGGEHKRLAQISVDVLHPVPIAPVKIEARVVRPGGNVDLSEATLTADGRIVMRAQAWRYRVANVPIPSQGDDGASPPPPSSGEEKDFFPTGQSVGYHTAMEWLFVKGAFLEPGDSTVWMRMRAPLLPGEEPSGAQRVLCAADSGSGVSARLLTQEHIFVNTDLTVALHRTPTGRWTCLDASTSLADEGAGSTHATIFDERGMVGTSLQSLYVSTR